MPCPFQMSGRAAIESVDINGKGIQGARVAECRRAVTARMFLRGGDSDWSEHANLRDPLMGLSQTYR